MKAILNILIIILTCALLYILIYPQYEEGKVAKLKIGTDKSVTALILFLAEERGFTKEQKLEPIYIYSESPDSLYDKLLAGECDLAVLPWSTVLKRFIEKETKVSAFISQDFRTGIPVDAILTTPQSKIKSFKDLKGKRLGYPPALKDLLPMILSENGINLSDIKPSELSQSEIVEKMIKGELEAGIVWEPYRTRLIKEGMTILFDGALPKSVIAPYPHSCYALNPLLLKEKRQVAVRLKIATDMAISLIDKDPQYARGVLLTKLALSPELMRDFNLPEFQKLSAINKTGIHSYLTYLGERGIVNKERIKDFKIEDILTAPIDLQP